jgi:sugar/nucleoside kinase (ribokinase family)
MVSNILSRRELHGSTVRPMFLWEPVPGVCSPEDWKDCVQAMKVVDVISPNVHEAAGFFGWTIDEEQPFEQFRQHVDKLAQEYVSHAPAVFRCGKHGCLVISKSIMKWLPAYHQMSEKVVDPTGGGNAFCGGFCAGWIESGGDLVTAAMYGNIAASFVIEQFGLPRLEYQGVEKWNGDTIEYRKNTYRSLCADRA